MINFTFQGCSYTFNTATGMIGGHMVYHVAHATSALQKFLATVAPVAI